MKSSRKQQNITQSIFFFPSFIFHLLPSFLSLFFILFCFLDHRVDTCMASGSTQNEKNPHALFPALARSMGVNISWYYHHSLGAYIV